MYIFKSRVWLQHSPSRRIAPSFWQHSLCSGLYSLPRQHCRSSVWNGNLRTFLSTHRSLILDQLTVPDTCHSIDRAGICGFYPMHCIAPDYSANNEVYSLSAPPEWCSLLLMSVVKNGIRDPIYVLPILTSHWQANHEHEPGGSLQRRRRPFW